MERKARVDPAINAVVVDLTEEALAAADQADARSLAGTCRVRFTASPVTIKINVDHAGQATSNGVVAFLQAIATEDSPVVANLRNWSQKQHVSTQLAIFRFVNWPIARSLRR